MRRIYASPKLSAAILIYGAMLLVLGLLAAHVAGVLQDFAAAIWSPLEIDYGEGIVWQQAVLIPGPLMYSRSQALPFIVFHYPPLFHLLARAMAGIMPSFLAAGRAVSVIATLSISLLAAALVGVASRVPGRPLRYTTLFSMALAGMLPLCLHVVHVWGMVMRVDAAAIAFAMAGVLVGALGNARPAPTVAGLLLCLCAVFTKQTEISAGVALFLLTLLRNPRSALLAAAVAGSIGLGLLGFLQWITDGGFLLNIVHYNINRFSLEAARNIFWREQSSFAVALAALASIPIVLQKIPDPGGQEPFAGWRARVVARLADRAVACRALLLLYLLLNTLTLVTAFKSGGSFNYLFEWLVIACAILGVGIADLARGGAERASAAGLIALLVPVLIFLIYTPTQPTGFFHDQQALAQRKDLVERIAMARKPVASDDMTLLMQAGKRVIYEPAIATELAEIGLWDETPLVAMIKARGFAFVITRGDEAVWGSRRTPAVKAAIDGAYPRVEKVGADTVLNLP